MTNANHEALTTWLAHPADKTAERIEKGIETHRKTDARVRLVDASGKPLSGVRVEVRQMTHAFWFSANSFMVGGYKTSAENDRWTAAYTRLFNHTVVPFYWSELEPQPGKVRFAANSEPRFRRPPPDAVLDWCQANNITPKGHNLIWQIMYPEWLPEDTASHWAYIERRFEQIAERYGTKILAWDVANEVLDRKYTDRMPAGFLHRCYELAGRLFPPQARMFVNETTFRSWQDFHWDTSAFYLMIDGMLQRDLRVEGVGMQYHLFKLLEEWLNSAETMLNPAYLYDVMDTYATYGRPIHISEITVPGAGEVEDGEHTQAELVRGLYRTWFSHPAVEAIVWWNLADGALWKNEQRYKGGLLRDDLSAKPAYEAIDELINHEWKTCLSLTSGAEGEVNFRGFRGQYELRPTGGQPLRFDATGSDRSESTLTLA